MTSTHPPEGQRQFPGFVKSTPWATAYKSRYTHEHVHGDLASLDHVNCGYLSTLGVPPTLLGLKQHAQSLAILIRKLCIATQQGEIDNVNIADRWTRYFRENEAFDWLNDLSTPYENQDDFHSLPLVELMNDILGQSELGKIDHICPLADFKRDKESEKNFKLLPYATHHNLTMHANECLEMLDHEYSATGGLMSLLPTDQEADTKEMADARNSLLGQWLLFNQHLVGRMHELEISYGNALDILAGEAAVPMQVNSRLGPDGSSGRQIAYPQDKWILANAGDDVFDHLHRVFDKQEAQIQQKEKIWKSKGVSGERMWQNARGGGVYARGIVPIDVVTRYYRITEAGKSTIFVLPAWGEHPAVRQTRKGLEKNPTVVSVVTPTWPARVSDWQAKYVDKLDQATRTEIVNHDLSRTNTTLDNQIKLLAGELDKAKTSNELYEKYYEAASTRKGAANLELQVFKLDEKLATTQKQAEKLEVDLDAYKEKLAALRDALPREYHQLLAMP